LMAARDAELLDLTEAELLSDGYVFLSRLRNRLFLLVGRPVDALPDRPERMEALGISLGFGSQPRQELEEAYLRTTRRVRRVTEPIIYG
jgi:[glutamine synthetase] adenylyltransferase / [glutamine synthetase]-adenylyl-L-tyrosine phosphorylase